MLIHTNCDRAKRFDSLFKRYDGVPFSIRLWDGWLWSCREFTKSHCTVVFKTPGALEALMSRPSERTLGEAFLAGNIDVEGDLFSMFAVAEHVFRSPQGRAERLLEVWSARQILYQL